MSILKRSFDWESLTITMDGEAMVNVKSVDWSDTRGVTPTFGIGGAPIGWGRRNYRGQGSFEIADAEIEKLMLRAAAVKGFYNLVFNINLQYGDNPYSKGYEDIHNVALLNCIPSRRGGASRQGVSEARIQRIEFEILGGITELGLSDLAKLVG